MNLAASNRCYAYIGISMTGRSCYWHDGTCNSADFERDVKKAVGIVALRPRADTLSSMRISLSV